VKTFGVALVEDRLYNGAIIVVGKVVTFAFQTSQQRLKTKRETKWFYSNPNRKYYIDVHNTRKTYTSESTMSGKKHLKEKRFDTFHVHTINQSINHY